MSLQEPTLLDASTFDSEVLASDVPVLVDFYADWCPPCRALAPSIDELAAEFDGVAKISKLDIDASPELAEAHGVQSVPTLLVFHGGEEAARFVGVASKSALASKLRELASAA